MVYGNKQDLPEKDDINKKKTRKDAKEKNLKIKKSTKSDKDRYDDAEKEKNIEGKTCICKKRNNIREKAMNNKNEYKDALTSIHEGAVWDPEIIVWTHELKKK